jgi:uncharacterized protein YndB with AHSA1/START domain
MTEPDVVEVSMSLSEPTTPATVLPYFTDPDRPIEWMGKAATLGPVAGGVYGVAYGDGFAVSGSYLDVDPPRQLAFTWGWAQQGSVPSGPDPHS